MWSDSGEELFVLAQHTDGSSELLVWRADALLRSIRQGLDAPPFWSPMAYTPNPSRVILALASSAAPGVDDYSPSVGADHLTWTRYEVAQQVVRLPALGGPLDVIQSHGQLPVWSPDGFSIAFTVGLWRLADMALNLDAWIADLYSDGDNDGKMGPGRPFVVGWRQQIRGPRKPISLASLSQRAPVETRT